MYLTLNQPNPVEPDRGKHPPARVLVDIPKMMKFSFMKWLLVVSGIFISSYAVAALDITPAAHDFGRVPAGNSSAGQTFTLLNTDTTAALPLGTIESLTTITDSFGNVTTVPSTEFIINTDPCSNTQMTASGTCQVTVVFRPKSVGAKAATLSIPPQDPNIPTVNVPLNGYGTDDPNIEASLQSYDFGEIEVGRISPTQTIQIFNTGKNYLEVGQVSLVGDQDDFPLRDYCSNQRIRRNSYCSLRVAFKPLSNDFKKATLSIPSNDPDTLFLEIPLTGGSGEPKVPNIEVEPLVDDFGAVQVGSASLYKTITIYNRGTDHLQLGKINLSGADFTSMGDFCSNQKVKPTGRCFMNIRFEPQSLGAKTGELTIPSDDPDTPVVTVQLTGTTPFPNIEVEPIPLEFGDIPIGGTSPYQNIAIKNTGQGHLQLGTIEISEPEFTTLSDDCSNTTVNSAGRCVMSIRFEPESIGTKTATLSIPSDDPNTPMVEVSLTGNGATPIRRIEVSSQSYDFGKVQIGSRSPYQNVIISNTGNISLQLGEISLLGDEFQSTGDHCSDKKIAPAGQCVMSIQFVPKALNERIGALSIPSDDSETPKVDIKLVGTGIGWCSGNYRQGSSHNPYSPNFGVEPINGSVSLNLKFDSWAIGCGALEVEDFEITGANATEFKKTSQSCHYGRHRYYRDRFYASCLLTLTFTPSSVGDKSAELNVMANGSTVSSIPLTAKAISPPIERIMELEPTSLDFGNAVVGSYNAKLIEVTNDGNVNLHFDSILLTGDDFNIHKEFNTNNQSCLSLNPKALLPANSCRIEVKFIPLTVGQKQAEIIITPSNNAPPPVNVPLTGNGVPICAEETITINSIASGDWKDPNIWERLQNFNPGENPTPNLPRYNDVVRIKAGHKVTAPSEIRLGTLCIDESGQLASPNNKGTWLYIYANDYIRNKGIIQGQSGAHQGIISAEPGASLSLWLNNSRNWKTVLWNEGSIFGGHGGDGKNTGADGGYINLQGNNVNVINSGTGTIDGGRGGNITGTAKGKGGKGGNITVRSRHLKSAGKGIHGGNGGNCNPAATEPQTGGYGGDLVLNGGNVEIVSGTHTHGKGGTGCEPLGENGKDGRRVSIDPNVLTLSGINTKIEGNDVAIFGGKDWILNLSNLNHTVVVADGDIDLAVGEGGIIDFRGSTSKILEAKGQVHIFTDTILLDEGTTLSDIIEATNIVVGPNKILYQVSLTGPGKLYGTAGDTLPIRFILTNAGPETDTYFLSVTDSAGWNFTPLQPTIEVQGLDTMELTLDVTLPALLDETDIITVTAISQSDPEVTATAEVGITVVPIEEITQSGLPSDQSGFLEGISPPPQPLSACAPHGIIDRVCRNNRDQVLTDVIIENRGSVSGGILAGNITNGGIISQVHVQEGAVVNGGKLTGYINNEGTLSNIEFVGALVIGGTLAGTIDNNSKVGGTFKDVHLAPNAHLKGGYLQGRIAGDMEAPALLENVTIKADSLLTGVQLGEGVILGENVECGEGVQAAEGVCPSDSELPNLGATTVNAQGETITTDAHFRGGISVNNGPFERQATLTISDLVTILGHIQVDQAHVGEEAEVVVYVSYQPLSVAPNEPLNYFMLNEKGDILGWDGADLTALVPFQPAAPLGPELEIEMYQGVLPATGIINIWFGYRLVADGTVVHNLETIEVTVNDTP